MYGIDIQKYGIHKWTDIWKVSGAIWCIKTNIVKVKTMKKNKQPPKEIPFEQTKCPVCEEEMEHYEDKDVEQLSCEKCGVWYNI